MRAAPPALVEHGRSWRGMEEHASPPCLARMSLALAPLKMPVWLLSMPWELLTSEVLWSCALSAPRRR